MNRGFDEFFGFLRGGHNFIPGVPIIIFPDHSGAGEDVGEDPEVRRRLDQNILRGFDNVAEPSYLTDAFGREAADFVRRHEDEPFLLYLSFNAVHTPMQADDARLERFASTTHPVRRIYNAMAYAMDEAIGAVMRQLEASGLTDDTIVFFLSDNGGPTVHRYAYNASDNTPLRGSKGTTLEAGIRVPFVMSWPAELSPGEYDEPVIQLDILPTVLAAAGIAADEGESPFDGVDLLPFLRGERTHRPHDVLYWRSFGQMAIREGDWKLASYVKQMDDGELRRGEPRDEMTPMRLYNLADDIGEANDLAAAMPTRVAYLRSRWNAWNATLRPVAP